MDADSEHPLPEGQDLETMILNQVEYYFSKHNLANDTYLVSKMNPQMFVPLEVVAGFKMLKRLTQDVDLIKSVLKRSKNIQLDESGDQCMIRPACAVAQRSTIILREIPKDVPAEEIKTIFPSPAAIVDLHADLADTWFVSFSDEQHCREAWAAVQEASFRGKPVKARIKSENLLKSFIPNAGNDAHTGPSPHASAKQQLPNPYVHVPIGIPYPFLMSRPPPYPPQPYMQQDFMPQGMGHLDGRGYGRGRGRGPPYPARGPHGRGPGRTGVQGTPPLKPANPPKLSSQDFPPLPSSSTPTTGYEREFKKWSKQEIIDIISGLQTKDIPRPSGLPACPAVSPTPIREIELIRNLPSEGPVSTVSYSEAAARKVIHDAKIGRDDIKQPEAKPRRNSQKRNDSGVGRGNGRQGSGRVKRREVAEDAAVAAVV